MTTSELFYEQLLKIRELFHKYGKFDDANAKLDEISKYLAIYIYQLKNKFEEKESIKNLLYEYQLNKENSLVIKLKEYFIKIAQNEIFRNYDDTSIFGSQPNLNIDNSDNEFCYLLLKLVVDSVDSVLSDKKDPNNFDILNESFGHFIKDNFRNHIEDAQYMTPPEVVDLICNMAIYDISNDGSNLFDNYIVCDPSSGVGSFLASFYQHNKNLNILNNNQIIFLGQDKVSRMVRLSKINMMLSNSKNIIISCGNSLTGESLLNKYIGKIDLIITNPPFGAKFSGTELKINSREYFPLLHDIIIKNGSNFNSEILFIDKYISLLKPNGKFLAVVPDSIISSSGLNDILRHRLINNKNLKVKAIIELPSVTFAQAGTRTKTSILYIEKNKSDENDVTFIAKCNDLGFQVSNKKGSTIKTTNGINELKSILECYTKNKQLAGNETKRIINENPSCVIIKSNLLKNNSWTPNHYNAQKFSSIELISKNNLEIELIKLINIVDFDTNQRKKEYIPKNSKCISVLHIVEDNLNYEELINYNPKYQGIVCKSGDLLFSKINPRIPRAFIIPNFDFPITCSSEFEIINSRIELNNYAIKLLFMLPSVQNQILSLTSGTSSSHNRIKSKDLANVLIPMPKKGTDKYNKLLKESEKYLQFNDQINKLRYDVFKLKNSIVEIIV